MNRPSTRVAAIQMVSTPQVEENMATASRLIADAARQGASLVLLPEYWPAMGMHETDKLALAEQTDAGPIQTFMSAIAREHKVWLIGGTLPMIAAQEGKVLNTMMVYDPQGERVKRYDKIHLFNFSRGAESYDEARTIEPGHEVATFDTPFGRIGLSVCYDLRFPELYRAMGDCTLIVVPAAFTYTTGKAHWEILLRARAIENQCYVLAAAQGGRHQNGRTTWGHSMLIDPWGEIKMVLSDGDGLVIGEIEPHYLSGIRENLPALTHRTVACAGGFGWMLYNSSFRSILVRACPARMAETMTPFEANLESLAVARNVLLTPFGLDESILIKTLGTMFTHRVDYADLYFQFTKSEGWSLEEGIVKTGSFSIDQGVGVRAVSGDKTAFSYSDEISERALTEAAIATRTIARQGAGKIKLASVIQPSGGRALYLPHDPLTSLDATEKVKLLERVERIARAKDPRVVQVMAGLAGEYDVVLVVRSDGVIAADIRPLVRVSITVIAEQNGRREMGSSGGGGRYSYAYFSDELLEKYANEAVASALVNLEARPAPAGPMTVVLGPGWPGILLHEAIGHGLEGDFNRKGSSAFSGRIGERVAAKGVTVVDDGTIANRRGSLNIDDEGNATQCTTLIEDGILKGYIQDTMNARLMKMPVTGNARRESFAHLPMPRMTNTYMLGGDKDPAEILASVKNGLYAVNFGGGQVDITNGKFVFSASEAYMIENGKVTYPVKGATLIGNGPDVLNRVSMIGNDMRLDSGVGVCGKEGQSVPVGVGQPTLRIDGVTVGGTA